MIQAIINVLSVYLARIVGVASLLQVVCLMSVLHVRMTLLVRNSHHILIVSLRPSQSKENALNAQIIHIAEQIHTATHSILALSALITVNVVHIYHFATITTVIIVLTHPLTVQ